MSPSPITSPNSKSPTALTVSQLNRKARQLLETHLNPVWVEGELTNLSTPSSGHWYFSLKDINAQIRCAFFKNERLKLYNSRSGFKPKEGALVRVRAKVSLYEGRGDYQLIVETIEDAGIGALQRAFEELKKKLSAEGLFDPEFKQELPAYPQQVGVITSPTGAAVHDILTVLKRRYPLAAVTLFPVAVQGKGAAEEIASAIEHANHNSLLTPDVLIVGRGGGSLEDLWAFNEEVVARAIFASEIPIVSAVGHEVDFSIADFVADVRAPTPSAAAELIVPDQRELFNNFQSLQQNFLQLIQQTLRDHTQHLKYLHSQLKHPGQFLQDKAQYLDQLEIRLQSITSRTAEGKVRKFENVAARLQQQSPNNYLLRLSDKIKSLQKQSAQLIQQRIKKEQQSLSSLSQLLHGVSPLNTLNRGYAIARDSKQRIIQNAGTIKMGDKISVQLKQGKIDSEVTKIHL